MTETLELMETVVARWGDGSVQITGWGYFYIAMIVVMLGARK